jgi:hypothetical protein
MMEPLNLDMFRRLSLEREFDRVVRRRQMQVDGLGSAACVYRGVRYECSGKPGHWGVLSGSDVE